MVNIVPVDQARHGGKYWKRPTGYSFAAKSAVVPLGGSEFSQAVGALPIGLMETTPGSYIPVGLLALVEGENLFVGPNGEWFGAYQPAVIRSYPFSPVRTEGSDEPVLGIDEDSGLVVDDPSGEGVEKFFQADGSLSPMTQSVAELIRAVERDRRITELAVSALAQAGVIKPWPLAVQVGTQQMSVGGLFCVDEAALNALNDDDFLQLRKASSLVVAYGHLLSQSQVNLLSRLATIRQMAKAAGSLPGMSPPLQS